MSAAVTTPGPCLARVSVELSPVCMRMATSFRFNRTSSTSSCRPSTVRVLVQHAVDLDFRDREAGDRRQQHATQRVAERVAVAALQRFDHDLGAIVAEAFDVAGRGDAAPGVR